MRGLVPGFPTWDFIYGKMYRDFERLEARGDADSFMNFCLSVNQLYDWVLKDPTVDSSINKEQVKADLIANVKHLGTCRDIANATKHCDLIYPHRRIELISWPVKNFIDGNSIRTPDAWVMLKGEDSAISLRDVAFAARDYWRDLFGEPEQYMNIP
jgi:hypothetical protein